MKEMGSRERLLQAAMEEFLEKGYAGARTTEIARRAATSHSMLHYYFSSKEQLYVQVEAEAVALVRALAEGVCATEGLPAVERVVETVAGQFEFLCAHPALPRFLVSEVMGKPGPTERLREGVAEAVQRAVASLQRTLDGAARQGVVAQTDAAMLLWDIVSVNMAAVVAAPLFVAADGDWQGYLLARRQENIQLILNRISPNM
ncbi:MAG: TetR/AcrR family transcriptional regulator [Bacteroidales bacterium]|nr:TetR/AcrR family transcriptional regulator [Bacteroidales bacterium]